MDELIAIQPEDFKPLVNKAHFTYYYYPQSNEYTLIVRKGMLTQYRAAIFDPIFKQAGIDDTLDVILEQCGADYKIKDISFGDENYQKELQLFLEKRGQNIKIN